MQRSMREREAAWEGSEGASEGLKLVALSVIGVGCGAVSMQPYEEASNQRLYLGRPSTQEKFPTAAAS